MKTKEHILLINRELNVSPVYRIEEGLENVHKNLESFAGRYEILRKNDNLFMFSEGICVQEKRLQKLRKGTARVSFGTEEKFGDDVNIVPVGIHYTYPDKFRKEVIINNKQEPYCRHCIKKKGNTGNTGSY